MPHISVYACDTQRCISAINIHADVSFSEKYFKTHKADEKLEELKQEIENIIEIYFDNYESDVYQDLEWTAHDLCSLIPKDNTYSL